MKQSKESMAKKTLEALDLLEEQACWGYFITNVGIFHPNVGIFFAELLLKTL